MYNNSVGFLRKLTARVFMLESSIGVPIVSVALILPEIMIFIAMFLSNHIVLN